MANTRKNVKPHRQKKPNKDEILEAKLTLQGVCVVALVILAFIDSSAREFEVDKMVYAIIAGVAFGVRGRDIKDYFFRRGK